VIVSISFVNDCSDKAFPRHFNRGFSVVGTGCFLMLAPILNLLQLLVCLSCYSFTDRDQFADRVVSRGHNPVDARLIANIRVRALISDTR
jgi:hypothetical protein